MAAGLLVLPVTGVPEVRAGDDLAALLVAALAGSAGGLRPGDVVVVSSKVLSKALGLVVPEPSSDEDRAAVISRETTRVVAERRVGRRLTRVVEASAGPVMAAAGVDSSNTGPGGGLLLLPADADAEAERVRAGLVAYAPLPPGAPLAVVVSDTAGRTWRVGQVDFALGAAGLQVLEDLRGGVDADRRELSVTARAVADELAAAADLVKGKVDGVPAAVIRGVPGGWLRLAPPDSASHTAASLVRTGAGDWFALGHVEAVRSALGVPPGTLDAERVGIPSTEPEPPAVRAGRAVALALHDVPDGVADIDPSAHDVVEVWLSAPDELSLGRLLARLEVATWAESLRVDGVERSGRVRVRLSPA